MALLTASTFDVTNDEIIDVMTSGIQWDVGEDRTISVAVAQGLNDTWPDLDSAIADFQAALAAYAAFIDIDFDYIGDFDSPVAAGEAGADIVFTVDRLPNEPLTFAYAYYPGPGVFSNVFNYATEDGDIYLNFANDIIASNSFDPGSDGFYTIIHELGHALGLKHPFEEDRGRPTLEDLTRTDLRDVEWFSIMSYTDQFPNELERWDPATPMLMDVIALQYMYGQNTQIHAGNTMHLLEDTDYMYTIWDPSGTDVLDASGLAEGQRIVLPDFLETPLVDTRSGFVVSQREYNGSLLTSETTELVWLLGDIEDAVGTAQSDFLIGSRLSNAMSGGSGNDELEGFAGDDTLDGNEGHDIAYYGGLQSSFTITFGPDGTTITDRRADGLGTDLLRSIETLSFYDSETTSTFDLEQFSAPTELTAEALDQFIELYIAYFNRAPDATGLWFWGSAFANGAVTLEQAASFFIDQVETRSIYPPGLGNQEFAVSVYNNVLGRTPDQGGLDFWVGALDAGGVARDQFILEVLRGAKVDPDPSADADFVAQQLADRAYLEIKTDIGALFAVHRGMSDVENARAAMALFDGTQEGETAAIAAIDGYHAQALDPLTGELLLPLIGVRDAPPDSFMAV